MSESGNIADIRLLELSTLMLSREDLRDAIITLRSMGAETATGRENIFACYRVADALSSITHPSGVQAIACAETVEEAG